MIVIWFDLKHIDLATTANYDARFYWGRLTHI